MIRVHPSGAVVIRFTVAAAVIGVVSLTCQVITQSPL